MNAEHEDLLKNDTRRMKRQETLQDGMLTKLAEVEAALHGVGDKHEVLFIGDTVVNCRKLAGKLNMHPGFSARYEEHGREILPDTGTIVLATHDPEILTRVKSKANGAGVVIMSADGVPGYVNDLFPEAFVAWNTTAAFGHITKAIDA